MAQLTEQLEQARQAGQQLEITRQTVLEKEQEIEQLHTDQRQLADQLNQLTQERQDCEKLRQEGEAILGEARKAASEKLHQAQLDAGKIVADANRAAVELRQDAEQKAETTRREAEQQAQKTCQEAQENARQVAYSIGALRKELNEVEERMNAAYASLRKAAEKIEKAAMPTDPADRQPSAAAQPPRQPQPQKRETQQVFAQPAAKTPAHAVPKGQPEQKSLSEMVLEKLTRLLG